MKTSLILLILGFAPILEAADEASNPSRFGPDKGVTAADPKLGFKLHEKAFANFKIATQKLKGSSPWRIPAAALVFAKEERHVYRSQSGYLKSIDVQIVGRDVSSFTIKSEELEEGDALVVQGNGFLSIVEEATFGEGLEHEH